MAGEIIPDGGGGGAVLAAESVMLPASMVLVQLFSVVLVLLSKLALSTGMRPFALLAYRNLVGAVAVAPLAFIFERLIIRRLFVICNGDWASLYYSLLSALNIYGSSCWIGIICFQSYHTYLSLTGGHIWFIGLICQ